MSITALLPLASLALKIGGALFKEKPATAPAPAEPSREPLPATLQGLFRRLGASDPNGEAQRPAIDQFMGEVMSTLSNRAPGVSLRDAIAQLQQDLAQGGAGAGGDTLLQSFDSLRQQLGLKGDLNGFLDAMSQTLPRGRGEGVGRLLATSA
ncbi:hypothetical protein G114_06402 [Aeromonas diversa CDC 2478-85]|uniref:Uncharacterized protein n=1 Tax=Aeromonas diversa CDC 2478-85 TaxID=1268237 RepID=N9VN00_9GAMM|nr:hypothetical protein [Aeromonas diversa]ENY72706.1 hypothetical protein G114_06402 [Aeromonas diversa CDC 2478-85]